MKEDEFLEAGFIYHVQSCQVFMLVVVCSSFQDCRRGWLEEDRAYLKP